MDTMEAFARGQASRDREPMVFDWDRAARLIAERRPDAASAGLASDWEYTGGRIFSNGEVDEESYTYLASTWATPELAMDGDFVDCYRMKSEVPEWGADTKWPESAREILARGGTEGLMGDREGEGTTPFGDRREQIVAGLLGADAELHRLYLESEWFHRSIDGIAAMLPMWAEGLAAQAREMDERHSRAIDFAKRAAAFLASGGKYP